jgi:hypothetical protein
MMSGNKRALTTQALAHATSEQARFSPLGWMLYETQLG